jgi:hypothetical protein
VFVRMMIHGLSKDDVSSKGPSYDPDFDLRPVKNEENFMVHVKDDYKETRPVWGILKCICPQECSKASWRKHQPWSVESPEDCLNYLMYHLCSSSLHKCTEDEAREKIRAAWQELEITWTESDDTYADREWYRKQVPQEVPCRGGGCDGPDDGNLGQVVKRQRTSDSGARASTDMEVDGEIDEEEEEANLLSKVGNIIATAIRHDLRLFRMLNRRLFRIRSFVAANIAV